MRAQRRNTAWLLSLAVVVLTLIPGRAFAAAPANDLIAGATVVASIPFSESLAYAEATHSGTDPASCILDQDGAGFKTLWYAMTPAADDRIAVSLPGYVGVDVFTGSPGALTKVACHTYSWTFQPEFRFDPTPGTKYYIMISVPADWSASFPITLDVAPPGPPNDDFDSATMVESLDFTDTVDAADDATEFFDDPNCLYWRAQHTIWYRYTPAADARLTIDTNGSTKESALAILVGDRGSLTPVRDCAPQMAPEQPSLTLPIQGGVTYHVMVGTIAEPAGTFTLNLHARLLSSISLASSRQLVRYGGTAKLTGHLEGFDAGSTPTVSIYRIPSTTPVASGPVDAQGNFAFSRKPTKNSTYQARWGGDDTYASARSVRVVVKVQVVIRTRMLGFYATSGAYHLFRSTTDPIYIVTVLPKHPDRSVHLQLQRYGAGSWRLLAAESFDLNRDSKVGVIIDHRALDAGTRYRIRATFKSDADHVGDTTRWKYFRLTT
jgi:hypothetical protein